MGQPGGEGSTGDDLHRVLVESLSGHAVVLLDPEGRFVTWNAAAARFSGRRADEAMGEHISRFFTEDAQEAGAAHAMLDMAAREGRFVGEGWRVRADGSRFLAHVTIEAIRDGDGILKGFAAIGRDVTEERPAERARFEAEQNFRFLVQGVRDYAIYMLDPEGRITSWNAGAEAIKQYKADEIIGAHFSIFYTDQDRAAGEPAKALATALSAGKYEKEAQRVRKDGSLFWASVLIDPIRDDRGRHIGFAKITRDITERHLAQTELDETRTALIQAQKLQALGELTGGIAHDFNNLMTVIAGSTELLLRQPDMPEAKKRRYLEAIAQTAQRATTLTSHLLAFGRRQAIRPEVMDPNVKLDAVAEVLTRTLGATIAVELDLAEAAGRIEVDPAEFETALLNAAFNARDAMPDGGTITLSTRLETDADGAWVRVCIADDGEGMPPDIAERAFEPFFTTKGVGKGTGLGLSQIHGFAAQAGGRAEIASTAGQGTTISLVLPRSDGEAATAGPDGAAVDLPPGLHVLLVENNDQVREFATDLLVSLGCAVTAADCAEDALVRLGEGRFDLVFSDVVMPGASGIELALAIAEGHPGLPVLLASGYSEEIVRPEARGFAMIRKPYGAATLSAAIAAALAERR